MQLIRNASEDGRCKYAIIDNRTGIKTEARAGDDEEFFRQWNARMRDVRAAIADGSYA